MPGDAITVTVELLRACRTLHEVARGLIEATGKQGMSIAEGASLLFDLQAAVTLVDEALVEEGAAFIAKQAADLGGGAPS